MRGYLADIIHDRKPDCRPISQVWMHLTTERSFESQATLVIYVLGLFFGRVIHGCLYNQALAGVRSTGVEFKCLYCTSPSQGNLMSFSHGTCPRHNSLQQELGILSHVFANYMQVIVW